MTKEAKTEVATDPGRRKISTRFLDFVCYLVFDKTLDELAEEDATDDTPPTTNEVVATASDGAEESETSDDADLVDVTETVRGLFRKPKVKPKVKPQVKKSPLDRYKDEEMNDSIRLFWLVLLQQFLTGKRSDIELTISLENASPAYLADLKSVYERAFGTDGWMFWMVDVTHRVCEDLDLQREIKETVERGLSICQRSSNK